jgi:hypothetical protein
MTYPTLVRITNPYQFNHSKTVEIKSQEDWESWLKTIQANGYRVSILERAQ